MKMIEKYFLRSVLSNSRTSLGTPGVIGLQLRNPSYSAIVLLADEGHQRNLDVECSFLFGSNCIIYYSLVGSKGPYKKINVFSGKILLRIYL